MPSGLTFENRVNILGGIVLTSIVCYGVAEATRPRHATACGARYDGPIRLSLQRADGAPMAPAELQARLGSGERGLLERARVVPTKTLTGTPATTPSAASSPWALAVDLDGNQDAPSGVAFRWTPTGLGRAQAACLSYFVRLPAGFDLGRGGRLPGLDVAAGAGGPPTEATTRDSGREDAPPPVVGFAAHPMWDGRGRPAIEVSAMGLDDTRTSLDVLMAGTDVSVPQGRWVAVEQEIVLASASVGASRTPTVPPRRGVLRLWIDGQLRLEEADGAWLRAGGLEIAGVLASIGYRSPPSPTPDGRGGATGSRPPRQLDLAQLQLAWR